MVGRIKPEFLAMFLEESLPLSEQVASDALRTEELWQEGAREPAVRRTLRSALHTIKGNSGMVGLSKIAGFVHVMEDFERELDAPGRDGTRALRLLVDAADHLVLMVSHPEDDGLLLRADELCARMSDFETRAQPVFEKAPSLAAAPEPLAIEVQTERVVRDAGRAIRVDFRVLDGLLDGLGEATSFAAALAPLKDRISALDPLLGSEIDAQTDKLMRELRGLRRLVTDARLISVGPTFSRFGHMIRELSRSRGLAIRFETRGAETSVDKAILDRLHEPLLHVLRNAVAHGIEPPEERRKRGKPEAGEIAIEARIERDRLKIAITDDGRGIDVEALRTKAATQGAKVSDLSRGELLRLVFLPGVSTAKTVDELSGRGVGLDAVEHVVRELDGAVDISSELGRGTRFELTLPSTASLLSGLVFEVEREAYVISTQHVVEAVSVTRDALYEVNGRSVFAWRELLPAVDARELLESPRQSPSAPTRCLVLEVGSERCGLLVDDVHTRIEGVVKSLDHRLCYSPTISGTTILPNGKVLPIVDARRAVGAARQGALLHEAVS